MTSPSARYQSLIAVFEKTRLILANPENDYSWSPWQDANAALEKIDAILTELRSGTCRDRNALAVLFAPTGPIQEVSVSSGWGNEFLALASEFDAAMIIALDIIPERLAQRLKTRIWAVISSLLKRTRTP